MYALFLVLKSLAHVLILPPGCLLVLAATAYGFLYTRWQQPARIVLGVALGLLWLLSLPLVSEGLWRLTEHYPALDLNKPVKAQAIVVIGGCCKRAHSPEYGGAPVVEKALLERLTYTAYVAKKTQLPVLVSGTYIEAISMKATLERDLGVKVRWIEKFSRDTFENAENASRILHGEGIQRIILVTSSTHLWRAAHEFMDAGFEVEPAPAVMWTTGLSEGLDPILPDAEALVRSHEAVYELIGEPVRVLMSALHLHRHQITPVAPQKS
jgi:uncharacterized SAM-binding protein YcdF (DUF218 family)